MNRIRTANISGITWIFSLLILLLAPGIGHAARVGEAAPDFSAEVWLNSAPLTAASERGRVVLVYFWTFGCHNCKAVEPYVKRWYEDYRASGLSVVSVHAPEFAFERKLDNVRRYIAEHEVRYPVAIDNDFAIWRRYKNRYWPVIYLIDRRGTLRHIHIGEGAYPRTRGWIEKLLAETPPAGTQ